MCGYFYCEYSDDDDRLTVTLVTSVVFVMVVHSRTQTIGSKSEYRIWVNGMGGKVKTKVLASAEPRMFNLRMSVAEVVGVPVISLLASSQLLGWPDSWLGS